MLTKLRLSIQEPDDWVTPALGFGIILYIILKTIDFPCIGDVTWQQIAVICGGPFVLLLSGYLYKPVRDIRDLGRRILRDAKRFLLPVILSATIDTFLDYTLQTPAEEKSLTYFIIEIKRLLCTLLFCPRDTIQEVSRPNVQWIPGIGIFWILVVLFFVRTIFSILSMTFNSLYERLDETPRQRRLNSNAQKDPLKPTILIAALILSIIGWLLLFRHYVFIPFLLDVSLASLLFFVIGILYGKIPDDALYHQARLLFPLPCAIIAVVCLRVCPFDPVSFASRPSYGVVFHILFPMAVCLLLLELIRKISCLSSTQEWLSIPGRHLILYMFIHKLDGMMYVLWNYDSILFRITARLSLILGVAELLLLFVNIFHSLPGAEADKNMFNRHRALFTNAFFILFAYAMLFEYHNDLSLKEFIPIRLHYYELYNLYRLVLVICVFIAGASFAYIENRYQAIAEFLLFWSVMIYSIFGGSHLMFALIILALAATGKSAKKTMTIALVIAATLCIISYVFSLHGLVLWKYSYQGGHGTGVRRNYLGALAPVDAVAHALYILLMCSALREGKNRKWPFLEFIPFFLLNVLLYRYTDTRADSIWILVLITVTLLYRIVLSIKVPLPAFVTIKRIYGGLLTAIFPVLFFVMTWLSYHYSETMFSLPEKLLSGILDIRSLEARFRISHSYVTQYKVWLFGSFPLVPDDQLIHNFIDSSYTSLPILYGALMTVSVLFLFTYIQTRLYRNRKFYLLFIMLLVALNSVTEQYLPLFQTNTFWILAFTRLDLSQQQQLELPPPTRKISNMSIKSDRVQHLVPDRIVDYNI